MWATGISSFGLQLVRPMGPIPINVARSSTSHVFGLDRHQRRAELQHDPILATSKQSAVPLVSTSFEEAVTLLERAEAINIPDVSEYRANLAILRPQFLQMRTESHRSPGFFQQFYLLFLCGLTWRLYHLKSQVDAIRRRIEVELINLLHSPPTDETFPAGRG
ncbi:hypothetical protein F5888DRAFT_1657759 [Russula emetica]|nr:hypothetical protein F5888DRAFT_1657759 [Russula emetica]